MAGILCAVAPLLYVPHFAGSIKFLGDVEGALAWLWTRRRNRHTAAQLESAVCILPIPEL